MQNGRVFQHKPGLRKIPEGTPSGLVIASIIRQKIDFVKRKTPTKIGTGLIFQIIRPVRVFPLIPALFARV